MSQDWHESDEFRSCLLEFHDIYARQPSGKNLNEAKAVLERVKSDIAEKMKSQGIFELKRYEHRGSTYEGVKIAKSASDEDLEFDIMFVINGGTDLECRNLGPNGYATLKLKANKELKAIFRKTTIDGCIDGCISASKTRNLFYSHLEQCRISDFNYNGSRITCRNIYHGPAVQIDVKRNGVKFFSIDLAPHFDLSGVTGQEEMFVAKAPKNNLNEDKWLKSFSLKEKNEFDAMDGDGGCRKMVLRTMKAFVKLEPGMKWLSSQHLKTALLLTIKRGGPASNWSRKEFGKRFMDTLKVLGDALGNQSLPSYFSRNINLLEGCGASSMKSTKERLAVLSRNEPEMMNLLSKAIAEREGRASAASWS